MNIRALIIKWLIKFGVVKPSFYINGAETLPPPLGTAEETRLLREGGQENRNKLIVHNLRLVVYIARKFDSAAVNIEDLISIGTIGLIKAVNTFRPDKNIKLATYASRCIENEILMYLRKNASQKNEVSIDEPLNIDFIRCFRQRRRRGRQGNRAGGRKIFAFKLCVRAAAERKTDNGNAIRYEWVRGIYPKRGGGRAGYFPVVYIKA